MVKLTIENGIAVVTLDDGKVNAINDDWLHGVDEALNEAKDHSVVLMGREGVFSAGLDLRTLPTLAPNDLEKTLLRFGEVMLRLYLHPRPIVAACTGHALAGGAVTLLTADYVVGSRGPFKIGLNETQVGITLPKFVIEMARTRLSVRAWMSAIVHATIFAPDSALEVGFLDEVVDPDQVQKQAIEHARTLSALPPQAYANNKLGLRQGAADAGKQAYAEEIQQFGGLIRELTSPSSTQSK